MKHDVTKTFVTGRQIQSIVDEPQPTFENLTVEGRAALLRLAADALYRAIPENVNNLRLAHQLATWANQLGISPDDGALCACGRERNDCVCDQQAAEHYLATRDASHLIGLGWPRSVLVALDGGDVIPVDLLTAEERNTFQKGATPVDIHCQQLF